mgnify:CR=1 FL=1
MNNRFKIGIQVALLLCFFASFMVHAQEWKAHYLKGAASFEKQQIDRALNYLDSALQNRENIQVLDLQAAILLKKKDLNAALKTLQRMNYLSRGAADYQLAVLYAKKEHPDSAFYFLERHLSSRFQEKQSSLEEEKAFLSLQLDERWNELVNDFYGNERDIAYYKVEELLAEDDLIEALQLSNTYLRENNDWHEMYSLRARILTSMGELDKALDDLNVAFDIRKGIQENYRLRAKLNAQMGNYKMAADDFRKYLYRNPTDFPVYLDYAEVEAASGDFDAAHDILDEYAQWFPEDDELIYVRAKIYTEQGKYLQTLRLTGKLIEKDPSKTKYFELRGDSYVATKTYRYALGDYSMGLDLEPRNADLYFKKGNVRYLMKDIDGACKDWEKASRYGHREAAKKYVDHCRNR